MPSSSLRISCLPESWDTVPSSSTNGLMSSRIHRAHHSLTGSHLCLGTVVTMNTMSFAKLARFSEKTSFNYVRSTRINSILALQCPVPTTLSLRILQVPLTRWRILKTHWSPLERIIQKACTQVHISWLCLAAKRLARSQLEASEVQVPTAFHLDVSDSQFRLLDCSK